MGNNFSTRQDWYLNKFSNPRVQELQKTISIRGTVVPGEKWLIFDNGKNFINPLQALVSPHDESQSVVILGIYNLFIRNEVNDDLLVKVDKMFTGKSPNEDVNHVDDSGCIKILCPNKYDNSINGSDAILYKPRLKSEILKAYCGLEDSIVGDVPHGGPLYDKTQPIVHFILNHQTLLQTTSYDFIKHENTQTFQIEPEFLKRVQTFFRKTIYDDIHRTRFEETKITCELPKKVIEDHQNKKNVAVLSNLIIILQVNYLLISPGDQHLKGIEVRVQ